MPVACAVWWKAWTAYGLSWPWRLLDPRSYLHTKMSFSVSGSFSKVTSPHFNRRLSSRALNPKSRAIIHHKVRCKTVEFEVPNSPQSKSLSSSASISSRAALGLFPLPCSTTSCRRLALKTSLESLNLSPSIIFQVWTSFVQGTLKTSLKTRQTNRLVLRAVQFLHSFEKFA